MGGRRSLKLQLQFLHLPCSCCLQETEFGECVSLTPPKRVTRSPRLERGIVPIHIVVPGVSLDFPRLGMSLTVRRKSSADSRPTRENYADTVKNPL
ncbi:hypothetical protein TNCV_4373681 [Trichonephila clavipes]|uniref:Secreted protein n=1 Tax=Trichonephila clavipes TaxID=2585209 RepID=A0A8X6UY47_TRICX|nr:hypothetical protein TNCV_4373681 [Trichonephila clavipes]